MIPLITRALISLEGLSVGDAFGELFFHLSASVFRTRNLPPRPWRWTDDTHMALSVVEILMTYGRIEQDALAAAFANRFREDPHRGYASGARSLLIKLLHGADWREVSPALFDGGSYGNGGAMRAAPIGGFFAGDPDRAAKEAQLATVITHAHPEGQAGAMAVAAAAALAAQPSHAEGREFIEEVLSFVSPGVTRNRIAMSLDIPGDNPVTTGIQKNYLDTGFLRCNEQDLDIYFCGAVSKYRVAQKRVRIRCAVCRLGFVPLRNTDEMVEYRRNETQQKPVEL